MNPREVDDEIDELRVRVGRLEIDLAQRIPSAELRKEIADAHNRLKELESQAKIIRFVGGAMIISIIGLLVNAIGNALF